MTYDQKQASGVVVAVLALFAISAMFGFNESTRHSLAIAGVAIGVSMGIAVELVPEPKARLLRPLSLGFVGIATLLDLFETDLGRDGADTISWVLGFVLGLLALGIALTAIDNA